MLDPPPHKENSHFSLRHGLKPRPRVGLLLRSWSWAWNEDLKTLLVSSSSHKLRGARRGGKPAPRMLPAIYRISGKHIMRSGKRFGWCVYLYSVKSWQMYQYRLFNCSSCEALVRPLISGKKTTQDMREFSNVEEIPTPWIDAYFNEKLLNTATQRICSLYDMEEQSSK